LKNPELHLKLYKMPNFSDLSMTFYLATLICWNELYNSHVENGCGLKSNFIFQKFLENWVSMGLESFYV